MSETDGLRILWETLTPKFKLLFEHSPYNSSPDVYINNLIAARNYTFQRLLEESDPKNREELMKNFKELSDELQFEAYNLVQTHIHHPDHDGIRARRINVDQLRDNVSIHLQHPWERLFEFATKLQNEHSETEEFRHLLSFPVKDFLRRTVGTKIVEYTDIVPENAQILHGNYRITSFGYGLVDRVTKYFATHPQPELNPLRAEAMTLFQPTR